MYKGVRLAMPRLALSHGVLHFWRTARWKLQEKTGGTPRTTANTWGVKSILVSAKSNSVGPVVASFTGDLTTESAKEEDIELVGKSATNPGLNQIPPICPSPYSRAPAHKTKVANYRMLLELQR